MKIKKLVVNSLYGELDFNWEFDENVNILAGINGSYKTTLLNIIKQVTDHEDIGYPISKVEAHYSDGIKLTYIRRESDIKSILEDRDSNRVIVDMLQKEHPDWFTGDNVQNVQLAIVSYLEEKNGQKLEKKDYEDVKRIDYVNTFDVASDADKESVLNAQLRRLQEQYAYYLSDLARQISDKVKVEGTVSKEQMDTINHDRDEFLNIVNGMFKETGKVLLESESSLVFVKDGDRRIHLKNLSAGEKQLLIILLTALMEKRQEYIMILDEPEISMHIDMQYALIDNLLKLNPNVQLIISTHSPSIFGSGWGDKVVYSEDLVRNGK